MRYIIALLLFTATYSACATDTLTRAQVFSFSVGDTFQYRNASYEYDVWNQYPPSYSVGYSECVIRKIYSATDTPAIVLIREWVSSTPTRIDSFKLFSPQDYEVMIDTIGWGHPFHSWPGDTVIVDSSAMWWGQHVNYVLVHDAYFYDGQLYATGFGLVNETQDGGTGPGGGFDDTTTLVYYSGYQGTFGTRHPFYLASINDINDDIQIKALPNPSSGIFQLMGIRDNDLIEVYNIFGQLIVQERAKETFNSFDLSSRGQGVYICRVTREGVSTSLRVVLQ